jgi:pentatricopeptide repeat protein
MSDICGGVDMEVSIVFESVPEAHAAVSELQEAWRLRFATIELAGQSEGYQSTLAKLVDELRGCGSNYQDAERIQAEYESLGVFADASVWRELVCIYNKSDPVQIDRAASTMWQLLNGTPFDGDLEFLLCESAHLWCSLGYVEVVEDIVSRMLEFGIEVPRAVVIAVLTGWIRLRDVERATQVMQTMQDRQCPPDLGTVNMLLALLITLGFEEEACSLLDSMENATEQAYHTKHLTPSEEAYLKKQMYVLVISGIVRHGNGKRAEEMVCRMIKRTGMQADALCINLVVEAWCIAGDMKTAKRVAVRLQEELKCDANEQTFALIAAGWAKAGKPAVACNTLLSLTSSEYDAEKIKLNPIITDWTKNRWRQPRGYCMTLPSVLVQKHAMAHTSTSHSMQSLDTNTSSPHSASNFGAMQKSLTSESSMWGPPSSELNLMTAEEVLGDAYLFKMSSACYLVLYVRS